MATLQVRDIDDRLYTTLKNAAKRKNRSISQEVVTMLETHLNSDQKPAVNATLEFLKLSGAWKDDRRADEIIADIASGKVQSDRFGDNNGVFD
jgi:plasmid stability protein